MEDAPGIWPAFLVVIFILLFFIRTISTFLGFFFKDYVNRHLIFRNLKPVYRPFLERNFSFYRKLNVKDQLLFEKRVQKFIDMKQFIPRGGIKEITPEMKALIAGTAIQLTFEYPSVYFNHFWRILIYPDEYLSTITHKFHKGEVNPRGIIVLSWKSFKEGFADNNDGLNLGLHEMAHALRLENIVENDEYDFIDRTTVVEFETEAKREITLMNNNPDSHSFFRHYSTTNLYEFFSVAVENFFERPLEFIEYNPALYKLMATILKIDPESLYTKGYKQF